jgi:hypothetical protein
VPSPQQPQARPAAPAQAPGFWPRTSTYAQEEIADLQEKWQRGEHQATPSLAVQPDGTLVLRPERLRLKTWQRGSTLLVPFALIPIARTFVQSGWAGLLFLAVGVALFLLVLLGLWELRIRRGAASLTASDVIIPAWYGRPRAVSRSAVARAAVVQAALGSSAHSSAMPLLLVLDGEGRCLLRLHAVGIPETDLKAFAAALGVPVDAPGREMDATELRARYPGSVSWVLSHQTAFGLLIALVIAVIVIVVVIGLAAAGVIKSSPGSG